MAWLLCILNRSKRQQQKDTCLNMLRLNWVTFELNRLKSQHPGPQNMATFADTAPDEVIALKSGPRWVLFTLTGTHRGGGDARMCDMSTYHRTTRHHGRAAARPGEVSGAHALVLASQAPEWWADTEALAFCCGILKKLSQLCFFGNPGKKNTPWTQSQAQTKKAVWLFLEECGWISSIPSQTRYQWEIHENCLWVALWARVCWGYLEVHEHLSVIRIP